MRQAYVVVGEDPCTGTSDDFYAVCHSMDRADALCFEAETENPELEYTWYAVIEEEDD